MLELCGVSKRFEDKTVLRDFSLALSSGETTCLLGPSGCGKTTLLRIAAGLLPPESGEVRRPEGWRSSFVFQEDRLLPWYGTLENITILGVSKKAAVTALESVLLGQELDTLPENLSGGMRRRLAIARALAFAGDCFFLDEPLRGLDPATAAPVLSAMRKSLEGSTGLLITHSPDEALALSQTLVMVDGPPVRIVRIAATAEFTKPEALKQWMQAGSPP